MALTKLAVGDEKLAFEVEGRKISVVTRPADGNQIARLFELDASPSWDDSSPLSDDEITALVRGLMDVAGRNGERAGVSGVSPAAALSFPDDPCIYVSPVEPMSFSLPGSPTGLSLRMDDKGDGHLWAVGAERVKLGSDGMWWIVNALIDALVEPSIAANWPRFLTLGTSLGGPATQASLEWGDWGLGIVWRDLRSGVVGDVLAVQELSYDRVDGWLAILRPVARELAAKRVHRQRLRPARTADKWARVLERWSLTPVEDPIAK